MQGSQMIMTGVSSSRNRTSALARLGFSYAIGMVVGPTLGGQVTKHWGEHAAALVACCGSVVSLVLVIQFVPGILSSDWSKQINTHL